MQMTGRNIDLVIRAIGIETTNIARVIGTATVTEATDTAATGTAATGTVATGTNAIGSTASTGAIGSTVHEASMTTNAAIATARATPARLHWTNPRRRARRLMLLR